MPSPLPAPAIVAHRGACTLAPENTLPAFALALLQGADAIELDVRATSDGELVVLHDATLLRTAGDPRPVAQITWAELLALDDAVRPPRLADVLDCFGAETAYLIDVKRIPREREADLVAAIASRGLHGQVVVQSFDHLLLCRLALLDPLVALGALLLPEADPICSVDLVAPFVDGVGLRHDRTDCELLEHARRRGLAVRSWTVNDEAEMQRLIEVGVDALITDVPARARALLSGVAAVA